MDLLPPPMERLRAALGRLPGVGPRTAERLALFIVQSEPDWVRSLSQAILEARERIVACRLCGGLTEEQPCRLCSDGGRSRSLICVVERPVDVLSLEKSSRFKGLYHVLGGRISPLKGIGPEDLRIAELEKRLQPGEVEELVLALDSDVEGDATCYYLADRLGRPGLRVTRLAHGLPVGSGLEFADELTIGRALEGRRGLDQPED